MANPEHLEWLLEGPESWNERRSRRDFAKLPHYWQQILLGRSERDQKFSNIGLARYYKWVMDDLSEQIQQEKPSFKDRIDPRDFFACLLLSPSNYLNVYEYSVVPFSFRPTMKGLRKKKF